jgi:hypothetical protein
LFKADEDCQSAGPLPALATGPPGILPAFASLRACLWAGQILFNGSGFFTLSKPE